MSLYRQCSAAAHDLMESPPAGNGGVFTEIDVVQRVASAGWSASDFKAAMRHANQIVGTLYRARKLCRFGPVELPDGDTKDYGRIASKIAYAAADVGVTEWKTPNGTFPALLVQDDDIGHQGRRIGTNRSDLIKWDEQEIYVAKLKSVKKSEVQDKRIVALEVAVESRDKRIRDLETKLARAAKGDIASVLEDLTDRIRGLEEQMKVIEGHLTVGSTFTG